MCACVWATRTRWPLWPEFPVNLILFPSFSWFCFYVADVQFCLPHVVSSVFGLLIRFDRGFCRSKQKSSRVSLPMLCENGALSALIAHRNIWRVVYTRSQAKVLFLPARCAHVDQEELLARLLLTHLTSLERNVFSSQREGKRGEHVLMEFDRLLPLIVRRRRSSRAGMMLSPCLLCGEMPLWHTVSSRAQGVGISPDWGFGRPEEPRMAPFHPPLSPGYHYLGFLA